MLYFPFTVRDCSGRVSLRLRPDARRLVSIWLVVLGLVAGAHAQTVTTIAGGGVGDNTTGAIANIAPNILAFGPDGSLFISGAGRVRKIGTDGIIRTVVGGLPVDSGEIVGSQPVVVGDGNLATAVRIEPGSIAVDSAGNLFVVDGYTKRIRKVTPAGIISTVVGTGEWGFSGDGGPGTAAMVNFPSKLAFDPAGNLYIADSQNFRIRKLAPNGTITTFAGNGSDGFSGDGGPAVNAAMSNPLGLATDGAGNVYFFDGENLVLRKVTTGGVISTIAGRGLSGNYGENGVPALSATFEAVWNLAVDASGNVYLADGFNNMIRRVTPSGQIYRYAGNVNTRGFGGDGGPATLTPALLDFPTGMVFSADGTMYFSDSGNYRIRTVSPNGILNSVYGNGNNLYNGDGGSALDGIIGVPKGNAVDAQGNIYVADTVRNRVRKISPSGLITTVAGNGSQGYSGDGGMATAAQLQFPNAVAVDAAGNLYISDDRNERVRKVGTDGRISTFAGTGTPGYSGDGGAATAAMLNSPQALAVDSSGNVYVADYNNARVRRIASNGVISTVAGKSRPPGDNPYDGAGGPASNAYIGAPSALHMDASNLLTIAADGRIYTVATNGTLANVAGERYDSYDAANSVIDGDAHRAIFGTVTGLVRDTRGNLFVSDFSRVRVISPGSVISAFAGVFDAATYQDSYGFRGDGGPALGAKFYEIGGLSMDGAGNLVVSDSSNGRLRRITPLGSPPPPSIPGQVRSATAAITGDEVEVSFLPPVPIGGVNLPTYVVRSIPAGGVDLDGGTGQLVHRIGGLVPGTLYQFSARASNPAGIGAESELTNSVRIAQINPTVSIQDGSILEGSFLSIMKFVVKLSHPSSDTIRVNVRSSDITAISASGATQDYFTSVREVVIYPGQSQGYFELTVRGDATVEPDETLAATITSVTGATISRGVATGTIVNDDGVIPVLSLADSSITEGNVGSSQMVFTATLSAPAGLDGATFQASTLDSESGSNLASAGRDYSPLDATLVRFSPGATSTSFSIKIAGDSVRENNETFTVSLGDLRGATPGRVLATGTIINDDGALNTQGSAQSSEAATATLTIAAVQGTSTESPFIGRDVTVKGVVTAVVRRGFYLQSSDQARDADARSSDAIYIATGKPPGAGVLVGNLMVVRGRVEEAVTSAAPATGTMTQLAYLDSRMIASGLALPRPMPWSDGASAGNNAEALEGMRVAVPTSRVVGPVDESGRFHVVLPDAERPMGIASVSIGPKQSPLRVASTGQLGARAFAVDAGDRVLALTGVLHQFGDWYELRLDPSTSRRVVAGAVPRAATESRALSLAQFNVGNFLGDQKAGSYATYPLRLAKTANAICAYLHSPDVLIVNEIADAATLSDLADALNARAGNVLFPAACSDQPGYQAHLIDARGSDGLYAGLLVRTRVNEDASLQVSLRSLSPLPTRRGNTIEGDVSAFVANLTVHKAGLGVEPLELIGYRAHRSNEAALDAVRAQQWLRFETTIAQRLAAKPTERLVVFADAGVPAVQAANDGKRVAEAGGLDDPAQQLPNRERYDAVSDGRAVTLSRVRTSPALARFGRYVSLDYARINADFGTDNASDFTVPLRVSELDPMVLTIYGASVSPPCLKKGNAQCGSIAK